MTSNGPRENSAADEADVHDDQNLHYIVDLDELDDGDRVITDIEGVEISVFNSNGSVYAVANYCVHQGGPLCEGLLSGAVSGVEGEEGWEEVYAHDNEVISCPWHGWEFDIKTGEHLARSKFRVPTYETQVKGGKVYVEL